MIKAVLFDFDETLQDRTAAFEKYMDMFLDEFCPNLPCEEREKEKIICALQVTADMLTGKMVSGHN